MTKADGIEIPKEFIIDKKERLSEPFGVTFDHEVKVYKDQDKI